MPIPNPSFYAKEEPSCPINLPQKSMFYVEVVYKKAHGSFLDFLITNLCCVDGLPVYWCHVQNVHQANIIFDFLMPI